MADIEHIIEKMRDNPKNIRFSEAEKVCEYFFGKPRQSGSSHKVYKMPWPGDPRINIQKDGDKAKPYQVRQILKAIDKLRENYS